MIQLQLKVDKFDLLLKLIKPNSFITFVSPAVAVVTRCCCCLFCGRISLPCLLCMLPGPLPFHLSLLLRALQSPGDLSFLLLCLHHDLCLRHLCLQDVQLLVGYPENYKNKISSLGFVSYTWLPLFPMSCLSLSEKPLPSFLIFFSSTLRRWLP